MFLLFFLFFHRALLALLFCFFFFFTRQAWSLPAPLPRQGPDDTTTTPILPSQDPFYLVPRDLDQLEPGSILRHRKPPSPFAAFGTSKANINDSHQILYRTTDSHANATATVLTVLVPHNADYAKVLSYQVAEDAPALDCAPSYALQLGSAAGGPSGMAFTRAEMLLIEAALEQGWVVIVPDFQGPRGAFLANRLAGQAILDGIRAAIRSSNLTGIARRPTVAMWGYSGGGITSAWAAELQPTYAPDLDIAGAAIGGIAPVLPTIIKLTNRGPFAGLIASGLLGLANEYPSLAGTVQQHLRPKHRKKFEKARTQCLAANANDFAFRDVVGMFNDSILTDLELARILEDNGLGKAVPTIPIFLYKSIFDEVSPVRETTDLYDFYCSGGARVEYERDLLSGHAVAMATGAPRALSYLMDVMKGRPQRDGCSKKTVLSSLLSWKAIRILPGLILDAISGLLGKPLGPSHSVRRSPPLVSKAESDDIYPVHMLDGSKALRNIVLAWTLRFNDVLDADQVHGSLSRLLEIGDWRKIGGRLRLKDNGELEIHAPRRFTTERPAVSYTHRIIASAIEDDPLAKTLPRATEGPSVQPGPQGFQVFAAREDAPATLEDFIHGDTPQLSLHITSFDNATLVGLSWPHSLMDVMGQKALLHGWSLVLAGRESEVPAMLGARADAMCSATDEVAGEKEEEFELEHKRLKGWAMAMFALRCGWDMLWNAAPETRTVYLPKSTMAKLRLEAQSDLAAAHEAGPAAAQERSSFVSEGDVLTAWVARAVASSSPRPRPVTVIHAANARFRLPSLINAPGVHVQNMIMAAFTFLSPEVAAGPLGPTALENRRHLTQQLREAQVLASFRKQRREYQPGKHDPGKLCGESDASLIVATNWTRANLFDTVDFSPAVLRAGRTEPETAGNQPPPGRLVFHHGHSMREGRAIRNMFAVLGKDHGDNYWLTMKLAPAAWARIEDTF
ncbi:hypothetical protein EsDP_00006439 [Epichloe bromicola]|uniref:Secretory lipase n=1 Tax=Epichloe bromicola TaxID=79588 RepID=A0ABQ0CXP6_9HYPO